MTGEELSGIKCPSARSGRVRETIINTQKVAKTGIVFSKVVIRKCEKSCKTGRKRIHNLIKV